MTRPYCVGLTGGIGSGKSLVASHFAALGAGVIDTDELARQLTGPQGAALADITAAFGMAMQGQDGGLDRARMRALVFAEPVARRRLEAILHPLIRTAAARELAAARAPYVLLVVPLLVETGAYGALVDRVLVVDCSEAQQAERAASRDGATLAAVAAIMASQASRGQRLAAADDVIDNSGDVAALLGQVEALHRKYLDLAANNRP
jgi:dephospho-CoA kinase